MTKLLLVEDEANIRMILRDMTEFELGKTVEIVEADNGRDGINAIRNAQAEKFRVVATDYDMPFNNGIEVVKEALIAQVPNVVLITARDLNNLRDIFGITLMNQLRGQGLKILPKPFSMSQIDQHVIDPLRP